jgi:hypothetical protein
MAHPARRLRDPLARQTGSNNGRSPSGKATDPRGGSMSEDPFSPVSLGDKIAWVAIGASLAGGLIMVMARSGYWMFLGIGLFLAAICGMALLTDDGDES